MDKRLAGAIGGVVAGLVTTAVMVGGRKTGVLDKTLDRDSVDWMDEKFGTRAVIGETGTSLLEFTNHLGASALFGAAYAELREHVPEEIPDWALAAAFGTGLYAVNIAGIAPLLGITEGEVEAGPKQATERWAVHVLQTVVTAYAAREVADR